MKLKSVRMEGRGCRVCAGVNASVEGDSKEAETSADISGSKMWARMSLRSEVKLVDSVSLGIEEKTEVSVRCSEYCEWMEKRSLVMLMDWAYARASCSCALSFNARARACIRSSTSLKTLNKDTYLEVRNYLASIQRRRQV
jgi:hypothetical protein